MIKAELGQNKKRAITGQRCPLDDPLMQLMLQLNLSGQTFFHHNKVQEVRRSARQIPEGWVRGSHDICPSHWADFLQY